MPLLPALAFGGTWQVELGEEINPKNWRAAKLTPIEDLDTAHDLWTDRPNSYRRTTWTLERMRRCRTLFPVWAQHREIDAPVQS